MTETTTTVETTETTTTTAVVAKPSNVIVTINGVDKNWALKGKPSGRTGSWLAKTFADHTVANYDDLSVVFEEVGGKSFGFVVETDGISNISEMGLSIVESKLVYTKK